MKFLRKKVIKKDDPFEEDYSAEDEVVEKRLTKENKRKLSSLMSKTSNKKWNDI